MHYKLQPLNLGKSPADSRFTFLYASRPGMFIAICNSSSYMQNITFFMTIAAELNLLH